MSRRWLVAAFLLTLPLVTPRLRGADEIEYYSYLRSLVFDGDLHFENEYRYFYERDPQGLAGFRATFLDRREEATGRPINFAPLGSALLWSPFYLLAHAGVLAARALGAPVVADGYSLPYAAAACFASALYGFAGLLLTHHLLRRWAGVSETAATLSVLALWLGSPVLYYLTLAPGFAHACSLFAAALLALLFLRARDRAGAGLNLGDWALVGAAVGLGALVREQDGLLIVIPGAWLAGQLRRQPRATLLRAAVLLAATALTVMPQLLAYRALNGRFGPSRLVGRKMSYWSPHLLEVLFDPGHGLFFWAPLLLLAVAGLAWAWVKPPAPGLRAPTGLLALGLLAQVWINGCIQSWSQAGAFGSRRFVGVTVVFAWGLALLVERALPRLGRAPVAATLALFAWWNVSLMVQFGLKLMDRQRLEWPRVAANQVREVPPRLLRAATLFFTDRERLVRETR
ncbi:MAG TPA: hypothetical protein VFO85_19580 [Vicinamibacteria bacterium]|nr:hypothetical protein [Vicinamibacteria bacterium]